MQRGEQMTAGAAPTIRMRSALTIGQLPANAVPLGPNRRGAPRKRHLRESDWHGRAEVNARKMAMRHVLWLRRQPNRCQRISQFLDCAALFRAPRVVIVPRGGSRRGIVLISDSSSSQEGQSMNSTAFDTVMRRLGEGVSRRGSLLTLGGAAVAATMASPDVSGAKKKGKKKGQDCKNKEKQRCNKDAEACKDTIQPLCDPGDPATCLILQNCCEECSANGFIECLILASAP